MLLASVRRMNYKAARKGSTETREKVKAAFQVRADGDTDQGFDKGADERQLDSKRVVMVEQSGLND